MFNYNSKCKKHKLLKQQNITFNYQIYQDFKKIVILPTIAEKSKEKSYLTFECKN